MKNKFKSLLVLTLLVALFVACEHLLEAFVHVCKLGMLAHTAIYLIKGLFAIHIIIEVIDIIFEVELRPLLITGIKNWRKGRKK